MAPDKDKEPTEGEVWAASLSPARTEFETSIQRKTTGSAAGASGEYVHFAGLDFSNMGR